MHQAVDEITIETPGRALVDVTREVEAFVRGSGVSRGLLTVFCRHTSASLLIQENADPDVRRDLLAWFDRLAPESDTLYVHNDEGPDDMPAHLKTALTQVQLSIPVLDGRPALGTWQGIYLAEHRRAPHRRKLALHLIGD